jgi:uncharacterized protein (DUF111 family)
MRRQAVRDIGVRERGRGADDEVGAKNSRADIAGHQGKLNPMAPAKIFYRDPTPLGHVRSDHCGIAPPQPHAMAGAREIRGRRERAVAAA